MARKKIEKVEVQEKEIKKVSLDNKPIDKVFDEVKPQIAKVFKPVENKIDTKKEGIKIENGRVYEDLGNGYGMYADNGEMFKIGG